MITKIMIRIIMTMNILGIPVPFVLDKNLPKEVWKRKQQSLPEEEESWSWSSRFDASLIRPCMSPCTLARKILNPNYNFFDTLSMRSSGKSIQIVRLCAHLLWRQDEQRVLHKCKTLCSSCLQRKWKRRVYKSWVTEKPGQSGTQLLYTLHFHFL